jgi:acyl-CoA thioesterase
VAALSDAWYPAIFTRLTERFGVPTVDLTVHLRSIHALERMQPDDWMAARFRTTVADEGFLEEDGQLWAPDGTLIAHSRQLGLLLAG